MISQIFSLHCKHENGEKIKNFLFINFNYFHDFGCLLQCLGLQNMPKMYKIGRGCGIYECLEPSQFFFGTKEDKS